MMPQYSPAPSAWRRIETAWGLPDLAGKGRFVAANLIDSLGTGLVMAFTVVFFVKTTSLSLVAVGAALTMRPAARPARSAFYRAPVGQIRSTHRGGCG